jgi:phosphatidylinositol alpha-mannosyltransferase
MRVALVFPNCWPYVRRGAERLMTEYARYLLARGHTVDIITSKPGPARVAREGGLTTYYDAQLTHPVLEAYRPLFRFLTFSLTCAPRLMRGRYDVAHFWLYLYGLPLRLARALRGTPYLYHMMAEGSTPVIHSRLDRWIVRRSVLPADRVAALTARLAAEEQAALGVPVDVLPACVDMETFVPCPGRDLSRPRVLFTADLATPRKGASLLLMAWDEIHRRCPEAILSLAGPFGQAGFEPRAMAPLTQDLVHDPAARAAIEVVGEGRAADLPRRYAEAAVTVLPSIDEAFGLVLIESLAAGTPVVGSASKGPGEIIDDQAIGTTVDVRTSEDLTNPERARELAEAVLRTIALVRRPDTAARCRAHARRWSRDTVGQELERIYGEMVTAAGRRRVGKGR